MRHRGCLFKATLLIPPAIIPLAAALLFCPPLHAQSGVALNTPRLANFQPPPIRVTVSVSTDTPDQRLDTVRLRVTSASKQTADGTVAREDNFDISHEGGKDDLTLWLQRGSHTIEVTDKRFQRYNTKVVLDGSYTPPKAPAIRLKLAATATISVINDASPAEGTIVRLIGPKRWYWFSERNEYRTDTFGVFEIQQLKPGEYDIEVEKQGFEKAREKTITLASGQRSERIIRLKPITATTTATLRINVAGAEGPTRVWLIGPKKWYWFSERNEHRTDPSGVVEIPQLKPGKYSIEVDYGFETATDEITLDSGQHSERTVKPITTTLEIVVLDNEGNAVPGAGIGLSNEGGGGTTDYRGRYIFILRPGSYSIAVIKEGFVISRASTVISPQEHQIKTITIFKQERANTPPIKTGADGKISELESELGGYRIKSLGTQRYPTTNGGTLDKYYVGRETNQIRETADKWNKPSSTKYEMYSQGGKISFWVAVGILAVSSLGFIYMLYSYISWLKDDVKKQKYSIGDWAIVCLAMPCFLLLPLLLPLLWGWFEVLRNYGIV